MYIYVCMCIIYIIYSDWETHIPEEDDERSNNGLRQGVPHVSCYFLRRHNICRTDISDFTWKKLVFLCFWWRGGKICWAKKHKQSEWPGCAEFVDCPAHGKERAALYILHFIKRCPKCSTLLFDKIQESWSSPQECSDNFIQIKLVHPIIMFLFTEYYQASAY